MRITTISLHFLLCLISHYPALQYFEAKGTLTHGHSTYRFVGFGGCCEKPVTTELRLIQVPNLLKLASCCICCHSLMAANTSLIRNRQWCIHVQSSAWNFRIFNNYHLLNPSTILKWVESGLIRPLLFMSTIPKRMYSKPMEIILANLLSNPSLAVGFGLRGP